MTAPMRVDGWWQTLDGRGSYGNDVTAGDQRPAAGVPSASDGSH